MLLASLDDLVALGYICKTSLVLTDRIWNVFIKTQLAAMN